MSTEHLLSILYATRDLRDEVRNLKKYIKENIEVQREILKLLKENNGLNQNKSR